MGFVAGALGDIQRRWETRRAEEAEARKEARLAAIRAQERSEDRAANKEMFDAQQAAINARDERNHEQQREFYTIQLENEAKRDERNFKQSLALQDRADARAAATAERSAARQEASALRAEQRAIAREKEKDSAASQFIEPSSGRIYNKPSGVDTIAFLQAMQTRHGRSLVPLSQYSQFSASIDDAGDGIMGAQRKPVANYSYTRDKNGNLTLQPSR